jgi:uncharacterized protein (UPF0335 family)
MQESKETIKDKINKWLNYDTKINELQNQIKHLKKNKKELSDDLTSIMKDKNTDIFNVKNVGKFVYIKKEVKKGINKKYLSEILNTFYSKNPSTATELCNFILENRESTIKENIQFKKETPE